MTYKLQPGVVLTSVCGEYLLVATGEALGKVAYARGLNETGAYFWSLLEEGLSVDQIAATAAKTYEAPEDQVRPILLHFLDSLRSAGYLGDCL